MSTRNDTIVRLIIGPEAWGNAEVAIWFGVSLATIDRMLDLYEAAGWKPEEPQVAFAPGKGRAL